MEVFITEDLDSPAIQKLAGKHQIVREPALWNDPAKLKTLIVEARVVIIRNQTKLTAEVLSDAKNLLAIGRVGVGLDNIDVKFATDRGIAS